MYVDRKLSWIVVPFVLVITTIGAWAVADMREKREADSIAGKMKTVCVGRFLIDMPADAQVELVQPRISGFDIGSFDESVEEFQARLAERERHMKAQPDHPGKRPYLESVKEVKTDKGVVGKIFVHGRQVTEGTRARGIEIENYRYEGVAVEALVHGAGISVDISNNYYFPDRVDRLVHLVDRLNPNPENRIPTAPGFCVNHACFNSPPDAVRGEQVMMFATLPRYPDVAFMLILAAGTKSDEDGLLERDSAAASLLSLADRVRTTKLRAGKRNIDGLAGEEVIRTIAQENAGSGFDAWWEVNGTENNVFIPHMVFKMSTGTGSKGPLPSSLSQGAAMALWDKISSSIGVRPQHSRHLPAPSCRIHRQPRAELAP